MKRNRYGSYDDYVREIDEEAERRAHEDEQCEGLPYCVYCLEQRDLEDLMDHVNKELDREKKRA